MLRFPVEEEDRWGVEEVVEDVEVGGGGGTSIRRTIPLLLEGEEEEADPKEVSNCLLLTRMLAMLDEA